MRECEIVGFEEIVEGVFIPFALDVTDGSAIRQEIVDGFLDSRDFGPLLRCEILKFLACEILGRKVLDLFHGAVLVLKWGGGGVVRAGVGRLPRILLDRVSTGIVKNDLRRVTRSVVDRPVCGGTTCYGSGHWLARRCRERMLTGIVKYNLSAGLVVRSDVYVNFCHKILLWMRLCY